MTTTQKHPTTSLPNDIRLRRTARLEMLIAEWTINGTLDTHIVQRRIAELTDELG